MEYDMLIRKIFQVATGLAFLGLAVVGHGTAGAQEPKHRAQGNVRVPSSVEAEHKELHQELAKVIKSGGQTASAAREVERMLQPHFVKEEQFALPPLAALADIAAGKMPANSGDIVKMAEHLKSEMPTMLAEHQAIGAALQKLRTAAQQEHKPEAVNFADRLKAHAMQEEEILYPSAILVGEYLRLKPH
jgi:iron-sulfur cluster repair protein YtfE (RIC family)